MRCAAWADECGPVIGDGVEVQRAVRREGEHAVGDAQVQGGVGVECRAGPFAGERMETCEACPAGARLTDGTSNRCTKQIPPQYASLGPCRPCRCTAVSIVRSTLRRTARLGLFAGTVRAVGCPVLAVRDYVVRCGVDQSVADRTARPRTSTD